MDGIRALAVLAVIIFHIDAAWLPGGFLGVDMFFVLSGYLITTIISREMQNGSFSFLEFYKTPRETHFARFLLRIAVYELGRHNLFLVV